jgi:hypothetical protein
MTGSEQATRIVLRWALNETLLRIPEPLQSAEAWRWHHDPPALTAEHGDDVFRFHVGAERRGSRKLVRVAVLSMTDGRSTATWEADVYSPDRLPPLD